jgi:hypothetical protein
MDLSELLAKHDQGDFLGGIAEAVLQLIMEAGVEGIIGAGRHERSGERTTWRSGYSNEGVWLSALVYWPILGTQHRNNCSTSERDAPHDWVCYRRRR